MKQFVVGIEETLHRYVIVNAEDEANAEEIAENLCNDGKIDLGSIDFQGRNCICTGEADIQDLNVYEVIE